MKRLTAGLLAVATLFLGSALVAPQASATDACTGATYITHVVARPDSAVSGGTWATDTFDRTTTVTCTSDGYHVTLADVGTFTTIAGGKSPQAGTTLPSQITGSFTGGTQFDVVSVDGPKNPSAGGDGSYSSSEWIQLVFPQGVAKQGDWSWSYTRYCGKLATETWTNAPTSIGDITGKPECPTETMPTSTTAPTKTTTPSTTAPATTTSPIETSTTATGGAGGGVGTTSTPTTRYADVSNESLASTGPDASPLALIIAGVLLLGAGIGFVWVAARKRASRR